MSRYDISGTYRQPEGRSYRGMLEGSSYQGMASRHAALPETRKRLLAAVRERSLRSRGGQMRPPPHALAPWNADPGKAGRREALILTLGFAGFSFHFKAYCYATVLPPEDLIPLELIMIESKTILPRDDSTFLNSAQTDAERAERQRRMMAAALGLLVIGLAGVLYLERGFWFPNDEQAQTQSQETDATSFAAAKKLAGTAHRKKHSRAGSNEAGSNQAGPNQAVDTGDAGAVTATRTVLPPLQVEVIASNYRRTLHPGTNSVLIDLRDGSSSHPAVTAPPSDAPVGAPVSDSAETGAGVTRNAADRAEVSSETTSAVTHSVAPAYPMLARQMKVQGKVVLEAMIGRDGLIQDLQVLSGPPILAGAAQEAVKQWHFKPHYQGAEAVETQTKITVNFTISTN